jgi:hypothetical protein
MAAMDRYRKSSRSALWPFHANAKDYGHNYGHFAASARTKMPVVRDLMAASSSLATQRRCIGILAALCRIETPASLPRDAPVKIPANSVVEQELTKKRLELTIPGANNDTPALPVFTLSLRSILIAFV